MTSEEVKVEIHENENDDPTTADVVFSREVSFLVTEGDGRTLMARIVPYNVVATVTDPPHFMPYQEMFVPGAFARQMNAANRIDVKPGEAADILLNYEHRQSISDVIGRGADLEDRNDGLYGSFRILQHPDGDKALELINAGALRGMSAEFVAKRSQRVDGVVQRLDARIGNVALCRDASSRHGGPKAAYAGAEVLAVRTTPELPEPVPIPNELEEKLAGVGVELLRRVTVSRKPWDGSVDRFTDEEYQRACLVDQEGDTPAKERCLLPVLEPNGDLNANAVTAAASALAGSRGLDPALKASAARKLIRYYRLAELEPTEGLRRLAST